MDIYNCLNKVVSYIEENLFDEIDFKKLGVLTGINLYSLNNAFSLISGYTIKEYIKLRRLSNSPLLLKKQRVIDVGLMCGYNSPEAFSRAFEKFHGFKPSKITKENTLNYFPALHFEERKKNIEKLHFEYKKLPASTFYGEKIVCDVTKNHRLIEDFWAGLKKRYPKLKNSDIQFGLVEYVNKGEFNYFIAMKEPFAKTNQKIEIENSGLYMSILLDSNNAAKISQISRSIVHDYKTPSINIEIYHGDKTELLFKIK